MAVSPDAFEWLKSTAGIGDAGCISIMTPAEDASSSLRCFGAQSRIRSGSDIPAAPLAWITHLAEPKAVIVAEPEGVEGSRDEVLRALSRGARSRRAASVLWDESGIVVVSFARGGRVVASVDLSVGEVLAGRGVPATLVRLSEGWLRDHNDRVSVGAAMVTEFTGVPLLPQLRNGDLWALDPVADDLETFRGGEDVPFGLRNYPLLVQLIEALSDEHRRQVAAAAAWAAAVHAALTNEPAVLAAFANGESGTRVAASLSRLSAQLERKRDELRLADVRAGRPRSLAARLTGQQVEALDGVRYLLHADPLSAALGAARALVDAVPLGVSPGSETHQSGSAVAAVLERALAHGDLSANELLSDLQPALSAADRADALSAEIIRQSVADSGGRLHRQD